MASVSLLKPLSGIKVVELSTMITASLASMMLADQGADVIKVEALGGGDPLRLLGTSSNGISAAFSNCNRGKKSVSVDLKNTEIQAAIRQLIKTADVVIHNFRPNVMERLGLGSEQLRNENSSLIFVEITGFGKEGPLAGAPAYDSVIQAMSGITSVQSDDDTPGFVKNLMCDKVTAYTAWQAVTAALFAREKSPDKQGQHIDISMLHATLAFMWPDGMANETFKDDTLPMSPNLADVFWVTSVRDGHLSIMAATDSQWASIFLIIGQPELSNAPEYADLYGRVKNIRALRDIVKTGFKDFTVAGALQTLRDADVPAMQCLDRKEAIKHPQVEAMRIIEQQESDVMGYLQSVVPPVSFGGERASLNAPAPKLGADTNACLQQAGLPSAEIEAFAEKKLIHQSS